MNIYLIYAASMPVGNPSPYIPQYNVNSTNSEQNKPRVNARYKLTRGLLRKSLILPVLTSSTKDIANCSNYTENPIPYIITGCIELCFIRSIPNQVSNIVRNKEYPMPYTRIPCIFFIYINITQQPSYQS